MGKRPGVRIHLTNVRGTGATRLAESLLPALLDTEGFGISEIYTPLRSHLSAAAKGRMVRTTEVRRYLPNALSRLLECTVFGRRYAGSGSLLVLGDLPIRGVSPQTVFVQTPHLARAAGGGPIGARLKYLLARWVFRANLRYADSFIVQTSTMQTALVQQYPALAGRVHVVPQPAPAWVLTSGLRRTGRVDGAAGGLRLFYPAFGYPHKNHRLLAGIDLRDAGDWPVDALVLTIPVHDSPNADLPWLQCVGLLTPDGVMTQYRDCDALVFLSTAESYGLPLVEAMFIGLPIVCPDLPYARTLCGNGALYFDPLSRASLKGALETLQGRLARGWWPDWAAQTSAMPATWHAVAARMLRIASGDGAGAQDADSNNAKGVPS